MKVSGVREEEPEDGGGGGGVTETREATPECEEEDFVFKAFFKVLHQHSSLL